MSQYGAPKPGGVWGQRPGAPGMPPGGGFFSGQVPPMGLPNAQMGMMNMGMVNQAAFGAQGMGLMGMSQLSHAAAAAAARQGAPPQVQPAVSAAGGAPGGKNQRTFVGRVTKMHDNYGFVDEDVFFQSSVVRGPIPRAGDRVMVEATFNPSMPFKWNAYRIQVLTDGPNGSAQAPPIQPNKVPRGPDPAGNRWGPPVDRAPERRRSPPRRSPPRRSPPRRAERPPSATRVPRRSPPSKRASPPRRSPPRERKRERERSPTTRNSSAAPTKRDSQSPPRRRQRIIPRYVCSMPRPLVQGVQSALAIRKRYPQLYVPSDFVDTTIDWPSKISPADGLDLTYPVNFHVLNKEVDPLEVFPELEPGDADHRYQVKVLLISHAGRLAIDQKSFGVGKDGLVDENHEPLEYFKNLNFLVGARGKEHMGIGGSYSPSLDGPNPLSLPTMIKTATRCCKALTGIDLSSCSQWYQLGQARFYRADKERVDRVTLLLPSSLQDDDAAFTNLTTALQGQLAAKIAAIDKPEVIEDVKIVEDKKQDEQVPSSQEPETPSKDEAVSVEGPTHWNELDVKSMKVAELRAELTVRNLDTKGIKTLLSQRLQEALDKEKELEEKPIEENKSEPAESVTEVKPEGMETEETEKKEGIKPAEETEEEKKAKEEIERKKKEQEEKEKAEKKAALEKKYTLPSESKIFVFPHREFKSGKFDCKVVSLKTLLEYRNEDNKETQFEVSLYAEAVRELIERHFSFTIYETLLRAADREEEKKKRDEAHFKEPEAVEEKEENKEEDKKEESSDKKEDKKDDKKEEKKKRETIELKSVVQNRNSFEAFSFYDQNLVGYLTEADVGELLLHGEFGLNRGLVQKTCKKWSKHDKINYRYITDQLLDGDGNVRFTPSSDESGPSRDQLIKGYSVGYAGTEMDQSEKNPTAVEDNSGVVIINGAAININQKLTQMKKLEEERDSALLKLGQSESTIKSLKDSRDYLEKKKKRLEEDVDRYRKKVHDAEKNFKNSVDESAGMKSALVEAKKIVEKLGDVVNKGLPAPPKPKEDDKKKDEKDTKEKDSDTSRDDKSKEPSEPKSIEKIVEEEGMEIDQTDMVLADAVGDDVKEDDKKEEEEK